MADSAGAPLLGSASAGTGPSPSYGVGPTPSAAAGNPTPNTPSLSAAPPEAGPSPAVPIVLQEAALDSPAFRAAVIYYSDQIDAIERWLDGYARAASRLAQDVYGLEDTINAFLGKTMPKSPVAEAAINNDYTILALRRFGESSRDWWAQLLNTVRRTESAVSEPIRSFLNSEIRSIFNSRKTLDASQKAFDTALARYMSQSKTKEPSALREDAFAMFETRKAYLKAALDFCVQVPQLRFALDKLLVRMSSDMYREMRRARDFLPNASLSAFEMERIRGWSKEMEGCEYVLRREMLASRREILDTSLQSFLPSRELDSYNVSTAPYLGVRGPASVIHADASVVVSEKQGWLYLKIMSGKPVRTNWVRRWYYCRNGVFGCLVQGPIGVLQGDEIGVLLCNAKPAGQEERRFCFEVKTKIQNIMLQAETQAELEEWLEVFEVAKKRAFDTSLNRENPSPTAGSDPAFSITPPSIPEFSARLLDSSGGSEDLIPGLDRSGTLPVPDTGQVARASFDVNPSGPRRALTNLAREDGETGRDHAARIMQKLDIHRKTTFSSLIDPPTSQTGLFSGSNASIAHLSLPAPGQPLSSRALLPPLSADNTPRNFVAPLNISDVPMPTGLSKSVLAVSGEKGYGMGVQNSLPLALLANYWGTSALDSAFFSSQLQTIITSIDDSLETQLGAELVVTSHESKNASLAGHKKTQSADTRITFKMPQDKYGAEKFPSGYPAELRAHHVQFRVLFPGIPAEEKLMLVFRGSWTGHLSNGKMDSRFVGNGRIYVTPDNMFFYGHVMGMIITYAISLDNISEVTAAPGKEFDYIFLHLSNSPGTSGPGYSKISIKTYLEDMELLHARLNLLIDDLQAEEPMEIPELISTISNLEKEPLDKKSPSTESWEELSHNSVIDNDTPRSRHLGHRDKGIGTISGRFGPFIKKTSPKLQLPARPVIYEPDDMDKNVSERHFEISAKACFHVLFGDKSFIFPKLYFERRAQHIAQGPWVLADHGKMRREFRFRADAVDMLGRAKSADVVDSQTIDVFSDHVTYVVAHIKTPWHLPYSQDFKLVIKVVITHLAKSKCKLAIFTKVDWSKAPPFSKNLVQRHALADAARDAEELADVATEQVRKLGHHSRTKRAIQVYGHVGQQHHVALFKPGEMDSTKKQSIKPRTLGTLVFETAGSFMESVALSLVMWTFAGARNLYSVVTTHRAILGLLLCSIMANFVLTSKDTSQWWYERRAARFMNRVGVGPNIVMSKAIYLNDLEEVMRNTSSPRPNGTTSTFESTEDRSDSKSRGDSCYSTFKTISSMTELDSPFDEVGGAFLSSNSKSTVRRLRRAKQRLGSYRHDLVVAMRIVNSIERETIQSEWENWLADENARCEQVKSIIDHAISRGKEQAEQQKEPSEEKRQKLGNLGEWHRNYCGSCRKEQEAIANSHQALY